MNEESSVQTLCAIINQMSGKPLELDEDSESSSDEALNRTRSKKPLEFSDSEEISPKQLKFNEELVRLSKNLVLLQARRLTIKIK